MKDCFNNKEEVSQFLSDFNRIMLDKVMSDDKMSMNFEDASFAIAVFKDKGMTNTRQLLYGTPIECLVVIISLLENIMNLGLFNDEDSETIKSDVKKLVEDLIGKRKSDDEVS